MTTLHAFADDPKQAPQHLASALGLSPHWIMMRRFPDGETLLRVGEVGPVALLYRSLHDPNAKLIETLLAADALRRAGARRIILVAPYLPYLRQDAVFAPGEPLSRDVILPLIAGPFETVITVDPHLHRTAHLEDVAAGARWIVLSGAAAIARGLKADDDPLPDILVGPDRESDQWVKLVAQALGRPFWTFEKHRLADRRVSLTAPGNAEVRGRRVLLIDDVCSSGGTLATAARHLHEGGVASVEAAVTHALFSETDAAALGEAGVSRVRSCDGCPHPSNAFPLAPLLAETLRQESLA
jgi:ribose-phosphate pyrophosphokinase